MNRSIAKLSCFLSLAARCLLAALAAKNQPRYVSFFIVVVTKHSIPYNISSTGEWVWVDRKRVCIAETEKMKSFKKVKMAIAATHEVEAESNRGDNHKALELAQRPSPLIRKASELPQSPQKREVC